MEIEPQSSEILTLYITTDRSDKIIDFFEKTSPAETARSIAHLDEDSREKLIQLLDPEKAAALLREDGVFFIPDAHVLPLPIRDTGGA